MKKIVSLALAILICIAFMATSFASGNISLKDLADRKIQGQDKLSNGHYNDNPIIDGESPVTGLPWSGYYQPMLVQIDLTDGGIGYRAPWGAVDADITYETPLYKNGTTRMSFLFSDTLPESVGPVRSARVGHCWLREEWQAGFLFYGSQELKGSSCSAVFKETGANKKGVIFSGIVGAGKPWAQYYNRIENLKAPSNVNANVKAIAALIPENHIATPHPFLFSDELPSMGENASVISIDLHNKVYNSEFRYNSDTKSYERYVQGQRFHNRDFKTGETTDLSYQNLIIQRTKVGWNKGNGVAPITEHIGKGNADIFIGGKYIAGYWERPDYQSRTVYMDENGNEIMLQRGKTFILVTQYDTNVSYSN